MQRSDVKILIVEDELSIVEFIRYNLEAENYEVEYALDGEEAIEKIKKGDIDLILMDLMLPKIDGVTLTKLLRKNTQTATIPIIMLTAKSTEIDKVVGLEVGADDYITKPFSIRELIARIKALLRRSSTAAQGSDVLQIGNLVINEEEFTATLGDKELELTLKEFLLLKILVENRGKVLTRDFLLDKVWGYDYVGESRTVDVHIRHLRSKLGEDADFIKTVRGMGYKAQ
ncbi:MAG: response regulator transcription factor [Tissierellia bacterium]|nr:response regulator transcription factor [Tissierellia bacterium]